MEKYLIGDIQNYYFLSEIRTKGLNQDTLQVKTNLRSNIENYDDEFKKNGIRSIYGNGLVWNYSHSANLSYIVTHPMTVQKYTTSDLYILEEGMEFVESKQGYYNKDTGLVLIETDEEHLYVASLDEIKFFTISVIRFDNKDLFLPFKLMNHRLNFWNEHLDTVFHTFDLSENYREKFVPFVGMLKEFILLQDEYVYQYFLSNILNILNEAKNMINSDFDDKDKIELLNETKEVLDKLKDSINDVSPYHYEDVHSVEYYIEKYYEKEQIKQEEIEKAKQKQLEEEKKQEQERMKRKKDYLETIKAKSELLDYFNSEMIKLG